MKRAIRDRPVNPDVPIKVIWDDNAHEIHSDDDSESTGPAEPKVENFVVPGVRKLTISPEEVEIDLKLKDFSRPDNYIVTKERTELDYDDVVEYDLDSEDELFVAKMSKHKWSKQKYKNFKLTPDVFELIMDYLEKESFKQKEFSQLLLPEVKKEAVNDDEEDDIPCCVCNERDYHDGNLIVFCDGCDIAVHQECQGLKVIPKGIWFCDRCKYYDIKSSDEEEEHNEQAKKQKSTTATSRKGGKLGKSVKKGKRKSKSTSSKNEDKEDKEEDEDEDEEEQQQQQGDDIEIIRKKPKRTSSKSLKYADKREKQTITKREKLKKEKLLTTLQCSMCHQSGGAMKRTSKKDSWIHILCAFWIPEFFFDENYELVNVDKQSAQRMELECSVCALKGGCIQCHKGACVVAYHPTCAQINGQYMALEEMKKKTKKRKRGNGGIIGGSEKGKEPVMVCVSYCKTHTVMKHNDALEKAIINGNAKVQLGRFIDIYTKQEIQKRLNTKIPKESFVVTANYWKDRRYALGEGRRPLIRRLLIETEDEKKRQELELNKRRYLLKERTNMDKYKVLRAIRADLERARTIIDLLRKREKMKLARYKMIYRIIDLYYNKIHPPPPLVLKIKLCPAVCAVLGIPNERLPLPSNDNSTPFNVNNTDHKNNNRFTTVNNLNKTKDVKSLQPSQEGYLSHQKKQLEADNEYLDSPSTSDASKPFSDSPKIRVVYNHHKDLQHEDKHKDHNANQNQNQNQNQDQGSTKCYKSPPFQTNYESSGPYHSTDNSDDDDDEDDEKS